MTKVRQDAWSHEDDLLLAETVLRHVRDGSTQLNAFEEVGDILNRTSAACGFRWNAEVRKKYENAMDLAKRQRKEKKRALARTGNKTKPNKQLKNRNTDYQLLESDHPALSLDVIIQFLKNMKSKSFQQEKSQQDLTHYQQENTRLLEEINQLKGKLTDTENELTTIQQDYQTFIEIMDRARKMTVLDGESSVKPPMFRMDKNGNLEQVVRKLNS